MKSTVIPSGRICSFPRVCIRLQREGEGRERMEEKKKTRERKRKGEREGSKHEGEEGWSGACKSKVFYSLNIGPNQTPSAPVRARI